MSDVVIHAENLGKKYTIGHQIQRERYTALRDVLVRNARTLWHKTRDLAQGKPIIPGDTTEDVWALRDVNFEIKRGEAVGIIGRNGAGKSTLLKVLSRITEPSAGRVTIKGRVASLLEVGTGFHPELTGRENIYLNGAILGMTRAEIKRKFDEIVDFAEVEKFLDTPVKRYSSGMYVRLAFAVAAHLEPEILVVDEVLAVGDAAFQKKCLGKMGDVAGEGRTVLFVSHNMAAIAELCRRCMVLRDGNIALFSGDVAAAINRYLDGANWGNRADRQVTALESEFFRVLDLRTLRSSTKEYSSSFTKSEDILVEIAMDILKTDRALNFGYALYETKTNVCLWWSFILDSQIHELDTGSKVFQTSIPAALLSDGNYRMEFVAALHNQGWIVRPGQHDLIVEFDITGGNIGTTFLSTTRRPGLLSPVFDWKVM